MLGRHAGELTRLGAAPRRARARPRRRRSPPIPRRRSTDCSKRWSERPGGGVGGAADPLRHRRPALGGEADPPHAAPHRDVAPIAARLLIVGTYRDSDLYRVAAARRGAGRPPPARARRADRAHGPRRARGGRVHRRGSPATSSTRAGVALAQMIYDETDGNPLFTGEVLRHLRETGAIYEQDGRWTTRGDVTAIGIPDGVREVIGRRLSRLSDRHQRGAPARGRRRPQLRSRGARAPGRPRPRRPRRRRSTRRSRRASSPRSDVAHYMFSHALGALRAVRRAAPDPPGPPPRAGRARRCRSCTPMRSSRTSASSRTTTPTASAPATSTRRSSTRSSRASGRSRSSPSTTRSPGSSRPATSSRTASGDPRSSPTCSWGSGVAEKYAGVPDVPRHAARRGGARREGRRPRGAGGGGAREHPRVLEQLRRRRPRARRRVPHRDRGADTVDAGRAGEAARQPRGGDRVRGGPRHAPGARRRGAGDRARRSADDATLADVLVSRCVALVGHEHARRAARPRPRARRAHRGDRRPAPRVLRGWYRFAALVEAGRDPRGRRRPRRVHRSGAEPRAGHPRVERRVHPCRACAAGRRLGRPRRRSRPSSTRSASGSATPTPSSSTACCCSASGSSRGGWPRSPTWCATRARATECPTGSTACGASPPARSARTTRRVGCSTAWRRTGS